MDYDWYVYMVRCRSGALYTGITTDVEDRIKTHNAGKGAKAVLALGIPVELAYHKKVGTYGEALREEARIKKLTKRQKEAMVEPSV